MEPRGAAKATLVIEALEGQLITNKIVWNASMLNETLISDTALDMLKIVVVNRYFNAPVAKASLDSSDHSPIVI